MKDRPLLIVLSIVIGMVVSCVILPLGGMALLVMLGSNDGLPRPAPTWSEEIISGSGQDRIVVIEVAGVIGGDGGSALFSSQLTHEDLLSQIRQAAKDERVKAVVLRVDSPGGGVVASSEIHAALKKLRAANKRLVVSMGTTAASGGYYIATQGERIYANPDTLTGSLGVIVSIVNVDETFEKLGIRSIVYKSGEFKDMGSPTRNPTSAEERIWQSLIDQAYQGFVDVITEGRNLPRQEVLEIADGRVYTGRQALDLKLIDALGDLEEAIAGAQELAKLEEALVVRYSSGASLGDLLMGLAQSRQPADPIGLRTLTHPQSPKLEYRMVP